MEGIIDPLHSEQFSHCAWTKNKFVDDTDVTEDSNTDSANYRKRVRDASMRR